MFLALVEFHVKSWCLAALKCGALAEHPVALDSDLLKHAVSGLLANRELQNKNRKEGGRV